MTLTEFIQWIRAIPETLAKYAKERHLQSVRDEQEVERLDRIRNPSKYRGK
jgi:hypothetical protein